MSIAHLAQADQLQLLARLFSLPTAASFERLGYSPEQLSALIATSELDLEQVGLFNRLPELLAEVSLDDWTAEHNRLFECGVKCSPNETGYIRRNRGNTLADVAGFYRAFGFDLSEGNGLKHDHLVCELEFMALLLVMWHQAEEREDTEKVEIVQSALRAFACDHANEWLLGFCLQLERETDLPLYTAAAELLARFWQAFCQRHGIEVATGRVLPSVEDPGTPYECGMAEAGLS